MQDQVATDQVATDQVVALLMCVVEYCIFLRHLRMRVFCLYPSESCICPEYLMTNPQITQMKEDRGWADSTSTKRPAIA